MRETKTRERETGEVIANDNEPQRQRARNLTKDGVQREQLAANDNKPLDLTAREAQNMTQREIERRLREEEEARKRQAMQPGAF